MKKNKNKKNRKRRSEKRQKERKHKREETRNEHTKGNECATTRTEGTKNKQYNVKERVLLLSRPAAVSSTEGVTRGAPKNGATSTASKHKLLGEKTKTRINDSKKREASESGSSRNEHKEKASETTSQSRTVAARDSRNGRPERISDQERAGSLASMLLRSSASCLVM